MIRIHCRQINDPPIFVYEKPTSALPYSLLISPGCKSGVRVEDGAVGEGVVSSTKSKTYL
jgi:hypothetical protein